MLPTCAPISELPSNKDTMIMLYNQSCRDGAGHSEAIEDHVVVVYHCIVASGHWGFEGNGLRSTDS